MMDGIPRRPRWQRRHRDESGAIAVLAATLVLALLATSALVIDVGRVAYVSRDQQGATDRATLDSVAALTALLAEDGDPQLNDVLPDVRAAALDSLGGNTGAAGRTGNDDRFLSRIELGFLDEDDRFVSVCRADYASDAASGPSGYGGDCIQLASAVALDALRLRTEGTVDYVLAFGASRGADLAKSAAGAAFSIGSVSAASTTVGAQPQLLNELLSELLGTDIDVDLVSHRGAVQAGVTLGDLAAELGFGTVDELLTGSVSLGELLQAMAAALEADGDPISAAVAAELGTLAQAALAVTSDPIVLGGSDSQLPLLEVATGGGSGAEIMIDALELAMAALLLSSGDSAIELELDVLGELLPVSLTVIQPPRLAVGRPGRTNDGEWRTYASTTQLSLGIELPVGETPTVVDDQHIAARVKHYQNRLDAASGGCTRRGIVNDIDKEVKEIRKFAETNGLIGLLGSTINSLLSVTNNLLGLTCILGNPGTTSVQGAINDFDKLLKELSGAASGLMTTTRPTLELTTGHGEARLVSIGCGDPMSVVVEGATSAVMLDLPPTTLLDLGPVAKVVVSADQVEVSAATEERAPAVEVPPFPSDTMTFGAGELGLASTVDSLSMTGSHALTLPAGGLLEVVKSLLHPVLNEVDAELSGLLDVLGVQLGTLESQIWDARCDGRRLVETGDTDN